MKKIKTSYAISFLLCILGALTYCFFYSSNLCCFKQHKNNLITDCCESASTCCDPEIHSDEGSCEVCHFSIQPYQKVLPNLFRYSVDLSVDVFDIDLKEVPQKTFQHRDAIYEIDKKYNKDYLVSLFSPNSYLKTIHTTLLLI